MYTTFLTLLTIFTICRCSTTDPHAPYTPKIISYAEAASTGKQIFHPRLLLLSNPYGDKVPPTPGDLVIYFGNDKTPPGSHPDEVQRRRIYDPSATPNYQGQLSCTDEEEKRTEIGFYLWSVVKVLKEQGDEWCCQTGDDAKSIATYSRATVGLSGMRGMCVKCYDVGFAADEVMYGCSRGGSVDGRYVYRTGGEHLEVVVYHSRDRDLGSSEAQGSDYSEL